MLEPPEDPGLNRTLGFLSQQGEPAGHRRLGQPVQKIRTWMKNFRQGRVSMSTWMSSFSPTTRVGEYRMVPGPLRSRCSESGSDASQGKASKMIYLFIDWWAEWLILQLGGGSEPVYWSIPLQSKQKKQLLNRTRDGYKPGPTGTWTNLTGEQQRHAEKGRQVSREYKGNPDRTAGSLRQRVVWSKLTEPNLNGSVLKSRH